MIWQQAVRNQFADRQKLVPYLIYEENVVIITEENPLFVVSPVINMIEFVRDKMHKIFVYGSGRFQRPDPYAEHFS